MKYLWLMAAIILVALGVMLRVVETANGNYVFGFDQGLDFMAARSIAIDHKFTLIGSEAGAGFAGLPGIFHGPGYRYILAALLFVSSGNPYGAIVALDIISIAALWFIYWFVKKIFGSHVANIALILAAVSLPLSAQARMIWAPNFSALIALPFLYAVWLSGKKTLSAVFLTSLFAALLYHFELPMAVPAMLMTVVYFGFILKIRNIKSWGAVCAGFLAGLSPMILFESRHGWGVVKGILSYGSRVTAPVSSAPFSWPAELVGDTNALLTTIRESFLFPLPWMRMIFPWVLLCSAIWYAHREKKQEIKKYVYGLLLLIAAHFFVFFPYRGPVYSHYLTLLYFVYPVLASYVAIRAWSGRVTRWILYGIGIFLVAGVLMQIPKTITADYRDYGGTAKIRGKIDAINSIYEHAAGTGFNLLVFSPPVYTYPYDYILRWYASKRYGYIPGTEKIGTVYLLIEPDPEKPWSYNGWLETVVKRGDVVASWKLPSGFIVEKRFIREE